MSTIHARNVPETLHERLQALARADGRSLNAQVLTLLSRLVVNASVAVKLFIEEAGSAQAEALFATLAGTEPSVIAAPDLLFPECADVFRSRILRRLMSAEEARDAFRALRSLPIRVVPLLEISEDALDFALRYDLSVYDGCYSALAARLGVPLFSADRRLLKKLARAGVRAVHLESVTT